MRQWPLANERGVVGGGNGQTAALVNTVIVPAEVVNVCGPVNTPQPPFPGVTRNVAAAEPAAFTAPAATKVPAWVPSPVAGLKLVSCIRSVSTNGSSFFSDAASGSATTIAIAAATARVSRNPVFIICSSCCGGPLCGDASLRQRQPRAATATCPRGAPLTRTRERRQNGSRHLPPAD